MKLLLMALKSTSCMAFYFLFFLIFLLDLTLLNLFSRKSLSFSISDAAFLGDDRLSVIVN